MTRCALPVLVGLAVAGPASADDRPVLDAAVLKKDWKKYQGKVVRFRARFLMGARIDRAQVVYLAGGDNKYPDVRVHCPLGSVGDFNRLSEFAEIVMEGKLDRADTAGGNAVLIVTDGGRVGGK